MTKLVLTVGPPGSGKSTIAQEYVAKGFVQIERDLLRMQHYGVWYGGSIDENRITQYQIDQIRQAVLSGKDVIVSDTNIGVQTREHLIKFGKAIGCEVEVVDVCGSLLLDDLIQRNRGREDQTKVVPDKIVEQMYVSFREQYPLKAPAYDWRKPTAIIFDIDGTVADMEGIRGPFDWKKVGLDKPHTDVIRLLQLLGEHHELIAVSGRDETCRDETYGWLIHQDIEFEALYMRPQGSQVKDSAVKHDLYHKYIAPAYNVVGVFDDRDQVVRTWRNMGLRCYQVAPGNF